MKSKCVGGRISLILLFLSQIVVVVEAFHFHPLARRGRLQPSLNTDDAKEEFVGVVHLKGHCGRFDHENNEDSSSILGSKSTSDLASRKDPSWKTTSNIMENGGNDAQWSRDQFLTFGLSAVATTTWSTFPDTAGAKLYSENAANLERINNGDFSGGAVFNNNPDTERGKKRRAMTGCKIAMSREEASKNILKRKKVMSEKECNTMVMDGETEFMLQALRNLDCPTCANGIGKVN